MTANPKLPLRRSSLAQHVLELLLRPRRRGIWHHGKTLVLRKLRRWLVHHSDALVLIEFQGRKLWMPFSHELPVFCQAFPDYGTNLRRIARHLQLRYPHLTAIDVGANIGDTAALLRAAGQFPILCIEGSPEYFAILQANAPGLGADLRLEQAFVGPRSEERSAILSPMRGTARLVNDRSSRAPVLAFKTLAAILEAHPAFSGAKLLKIDTDGYDTLILRSAIGLLSRMKPVIFFEYDPHAFSPNDPEGFGVFEELRAIGYDRALVYDNTGDYLVAVEFAQRRLLEDLHAFYEGRASQRYCDVCAFHEVDARLCDELRAQELVYFRAARGCRAAMGNAL